MAVFAVKTFIEVVAKTLGAERAFEAHAFPPIWRVAPALLGTVPTPTTPRGPKILAVFAVKTFIEVVAKTFGTESPFDTKTFPATLRVEPEPFVPTPTKPLGP